MESSSEEDCGSVAIKEEDLDESEMWEGDSRRSAFSPYRSVTILTNLQRGNIQTQTPIAIPREVNLHTKSAMGELTQEEINNNLSSIDVVDKHGYTPLMWASYYGQLPTVQLLLDKKAKVDMETEDGETSLFLASSGGHHEVVRLLLAFGANVDHQDHVLNTALMYACHSDHAHCVSELLEHGADVTRTNMAGHSPFNIAVKRKNKQAQIVIERFLLRMLEQ